MTKRFTTDPLATATGLRERGSPFVLATVVRAVAPTSAKAGDKAVLTKEGLLSGWVGGACAEPIVLREAEAALLDGECRLVCISPEADARAGHKGFVVYPMTCFGGGSLDVYLEPYLPPPRLLVFGHSPVARALADLARVMKYEVIAVDLNAGPTTDPDALRALADVPPLEPERTYAIVTTHGVFDEEALKHVSNLGLAYTGLITSRTRREKLFASLASHGFSQAALDRIDAPAGVDLGGKRPEEIALGVMAHIVALRNGRELGPSLPRRAATDVAAAPATDGAAAPATEGSATPATAAAAPAAKSCCHGKKTLPAG
jgi:xanthine dehydrogenase accessory factor